MLRQKNGAWVTVVALSVGVVLGCGISSWNAKSATAQATKRNEETQHDRRLVQLEKAVTALTHALQDNDTKGALPETTCAASQSNNDVPRQAIAQIIRGELQLALTKGSPEREQARAQEIAIAQALNSPENRAAYQSASGVVHAALADGRWTDENGRMFRDAFVQLTNDQRMEIMNMLAPAINRGDISVETSGPLF
jgi:hypothetical protein